LILIGLNWWLKPFEYHPKDPNSWFSRALKLLIRPSAIIEGHSQPTPQLSHEFTPLSTDDETDGMIEYYHLSRSVPSGTDKTNTSSGEETKL